jgi:predicted AlkP superfamily pyrophosphatase or phosphodiesterase
VTTAGFRGSGVPRFGVLGFRFWFLVLAFAVALGAARQASAPIVILISLDGWRWDYLDRAAAPNLKQLAASGVRAEGLIATFPSKTFPSHYTAVTGLTPEHHGIVSNTISDPAIPQRFSMSSDAVGDPRWWGGEPIWVTAVRQGRRSATMFWPGSEAPIGGVRPTYWRPFDNTVGNADRVRQVIEWLARPESERPAIVTIYFNEADGAGHQFGPESQEVMKAAASLDAAVGQLVEGVAKLGLTGRTSFVVTSDHGMSQLSEERTIFIDDYLDVDSVDVVEWTPVFQARPGKRTAEQIYAALAGRHPALAVYRRADVPAFFKYRDNERIPPVLALADDGWTITTRARRQRDRETGRRIGGEHGYDPRYRSMHGLFIASGPRLARGRIVPAFDNLHLYEFLCGLLELKPATNDGDPGVTRAFFAVRSEALRSP